MPIGNGMTSLSFLKWGAAGVGALYLGKASLGKVSNILGRDVETKYEAQDNGVLGLADILDRYSSPFVSRYALDNEDGMTVNKQIYNQDLDAWSATSSSIFEGYARNNTLKSRAFAGLAIAPSMAGTSVSLMGTIMQLEAARKVWHFGSSFVSTDTTRGYLEKRVKGSMKYNMRSATGRVLLGIDNLVSSTWNMAKSGFERGSFVPSNKGSFIKHHFLYDGNNGLESEVERLAKVEAMSDIGLRDRFLYGKTFNAIDNLGLSEEHANEMKKAVIRNAYKPHSSDKFLSRMRARVDTAKAIPGVVKAKVGVLGQEIRKIHNRNKRPTPAQLNAEKAAKKRLDQKRATLEAARRRMSRSSKNTIIDGLNEGKAKVAADTKGARHALDNSRINKELSDSNAITALAEKGASSVARRRMLLSAAKWGGGAAIALPIVTELGVAAVRKATDTVHSVAQAYDRYTHLNFGSDDYRLNEASKSDRQLAVEAIQNASLNARYLLGNEASMYH